MPPPNDDHLAHLLTELTDQLRAGQRPALAAIIRQHPQHADELRQLWAAVLIAEEMASGTREAAAPPPQKLPPGEQLTMPRTPDGADAPTRHREADASSSPRGAQGEWPSGTLPR